MDTPVAPPASAAGRSEAIIEGRAYGLLFRLLSVASVGGLTGWLIWLHTQRQLDIFDFRTTGWLTLPLSMLIAFAIALWRSRSGVDGDRIYQRLFWTREVIESDIASARLIRFRGLDWLVAPRLYVRTRGLKVLAFYAADSRVLTRFADVAKRCGARRR